MGSNREVDLQGNCSKCGGVHFGTGPDCVYGKPVQNSTIPPTLQMGREQPQGGATPAQTEGGEKPHGPVACRKLSCDGSCGLQSIYTYGDKALTLVAPTDEAARQFALKHGLEQVRVIECNREPSSPPATAGTPREFVVEWAKQHKETYLQVDDIAACAEAYADQRVRQAEANKSAMFDRLKGLRYELKSVKEELQRVYKVLNENYELRTKAEAEVEKLRQEREILDQLAAKRAETIKSERESRERAEGALRVGIEKLELAMRTSGNRWEEWGERALSVAELLDEALASLKSSEGAK